MLRTRLFYGLLTLILLLWGVGAAALVLVRDANRRYQNSLENNYPAIKTARSFGILTSAIDAHYLPVLTGDPPYKPPDKTLFEYNQGELIARLASLRRSNDDVWNEVLDRLQVLLDEALDHRRRLLDLVELADDLADGVEHHGGGLVRVANSTPLLRNRD